MVKRYAGLPTIVSTHDFLSSAGERRPASVIDSQAVDPLHNNNPNMIWKSSYESTIRSFSFFADTNMVSRGVLTLTTLGIRSIRC